MAIVVIDVSGASAVLTGNLQRRMLEIRANLFVGNVSVRALEQLWASVLEDSPDSALLVFPARNELGFSMRTMGNSRYKPVDHYGIQLVKFVGKISNELRAIENKENFAESLPRANGG